MGGCVATQREVSSAACEQKHAIARLDVWKAIKAELADGWSLLMRTEELDPWVMAELKESCMQLGEAGG